MLFHWCPVSSLTQFIQSLFKSCICPIDCYLVTVSNHSSLVEQFVQQQRWDKWWYNTTNRATVAPLHFAHQKNPNCQVGMLLVNGLRVKVNQIRFNMKNRHWFLLKPCQGIAIALEWVDFAEKFCSYKYQCKQAFRQSRQQWVVTLSDDFLLCQKGFFNFFNYLSTFMYSKDAPYDSNARYPWK